LGEGSTSEPSASGWRRWVALALGALVVLAGAATVTLLEASVLYGQVGPAARFPGARPGGWLFVAGAVLVPALLFSCLFIPWLLLSLNREVEQKLRTQRDLEDARTSLLRAENMAGVGHWRIDYSNKQVRVDWSDSIFRILGHEPQSFLPTPQRIIEAYHPDDRPEVERIHAHALETAEPFQYELRAVRRDGSVRNVVTQGIAERDRDGRVTSLFGVAQDVTDARERDSALQAQAERLRVITDGMSEGVVMLDAEGRVVFWNPAATELFGVSIEYAQGRVFEQLVHLDDADSGSTTLDLVPTSGEVEVVRKESTDPRGNTRTLEMTRDVLEADQPANEILIVRDVTRRAENERELHRRARYDELTGLLNRGYFWRRAREEVEHAREDGRPVTLLILDIDHFKRINDERGHAEGDLALARFARCCSNRFRASDLVGRIGGEEFGVLLVGADDTRGRGAAEKLRMTVEQTPIDGEKGPFRLTVSVGVAAIDVDREEALDEASRRADQALYRAKAEGRNRVCVATLDAPEPTGAERRSRTQLS
jgi:diguanylate cyclase (GGDEF)-like protein/PAS domain S-box-containing protein